MLEYAETLSTIDHFTDGFFWCFSFISYMLGKTRIISIWFITGGFRMVVKALLEVSLLFLNILYLDLLMLEQCICKLCLQINIDPLGGMLIWFYSCMAFYLEHCFLLICLLCEQIMLEIFSAQQQLTFTIFLLNIL